MNKIRSKSKEIELAKIRIVNLREKRKMKEPYSKEREEVQKRLGYAHENLHQLIREFKELQRLEYEQMSFEEMMEESIKRIRIKYDHKKDTIESHLISAKKRSKQAKRDSRPKPKHDNIKPHYGVGR